MRTLVVYESKYGSTKQYAEWIAMEVNADMRRMRDVELADLTLYETIVVAGYLHMGKIVGVSFLSENWGMLKNKRIILAAVSAAGPSPAAEKFYDDNVPPEMRARIKHFALRGRATKLDWKDRLLVALPRFLLYLKYLFNPVPENRKAYEEFKPFDDVKREHIAPLVAYIRGV